MQALLFDFDGLILDTETPELRAWEAEFARWGQVLPETYWADSIGRGADQMEEWPADILQRLVPNGLPDRDALERRVKEERMSGILANPVLPGVLPLMRWAKETGVRVAVVSSSKHDWVDPNLERLGLMEWVETTVCRGDTPRAKPFPDLYLRALEIFGLDGSQALAIEDSPNGSRAALDAGLSVAVVPNPVTESLTFPEGISRYSSCEALLAMLTR